MHNTTADHQALDCLQGLFRLYMYFWILLFIGFSSVSLVKGWLSVCLSVNQGKTNHNCYMQRLVLQHSQIANQKLVQSDLVYCVYRSPVQLCCQLSFIAHGLLVLFCFLFPIISRFLILCNRLSWLFITEWLHMKYLHIVSYDVHM